MNVNSVQPMQIFVQNKIKTQSPSTRFLQNQNHDTVSFGMVCDKVRVSPENYIQWTSNVTITGDYVAKLDFNAGNNINVEGMVEVLYYIKARDNLSAKSLVSWGDVKLNNGAKIEEGVKAFVCIEAGDNLSAKSLEAYYITLGNGAKIEEGIGVGSTIYAGDNISAKWIVSGENIVLGKGAKIEEGVKARSYIKAEDNFRAKSLEATGSGISLGKGAKIEEGIKARESIKAGNKLSAKSLDTGWDLGLGSIDSLETITMRRSEREKGDATIQLNSLDIKPEKIKVYLGELRSLTIKTPGGNKDILNKFEFYQFDEKTDKPTNIKIDPSKAPIKVVKIPD